jgi:hypothetical protein
VPTIFAGVSRYGQVNHHHRAQRPGATPNSITRIGVISAPPPMPDRTAQQIEFGRVRRFVNAANFEVGLDVQSIVEHSAYAPECEW